MGVTDDILDDTQGGGEPDTFVVSETRYEDGNYVGEVERDRVRRLLREYADACRVFRIIAGASHEGSAAGRDTYSRAEHAGRVEVEAASAVDDIVGGRYGCRVRFDTSAPQLATVTDGTVRAQIEIDDAVVRFVPPDESGRAR